MSKIQRFSDVFRVYVKVIWLKMSKGKTPFSKYSAKFLDKYISVPENCPYLEFLWSVFSRIWTEYREIFRISPYSFRMRENTDQKN